MRLYLTRYIYELIFYKKNNTLFVENKKLFKYVFILHYTLSPTKK